MKSFAALVALLVCLPAAFASSGNYNYLQSGADWSGTCATGSEQSPVNIVVNDVSKTTIKAEVALEKTDITTELVDKTTTLQMDGEWLIMTVTKGDNYKRVYKAAQFHYHSKSEHTINGVRFDLEMHVVCVETDESKANNTG